MLRCCRRSEGRPFRHPCPWQILMGIPGGIDYTILTAVKQGWVSWGFEKRIHWHLDVWLRAPMGAVTGFLITAVVFVQPDQILGFHHKVFYVVFGVHSYWNSAYFGSLAVDGYSRWRVAQKASKDAGKKD